MATLDKRLDPKILSAAKEEFLKKGFEKASLREICKNAGVSTGAVYTRYNGKEQLFGELINETLRKVDEKFSFDKGEQNYVEKNVEANKTINQLLLNLDLEAVVHFIYDNYDEFRLLINCSSGSVYSDFAHSFVDKSQGILYYYLKRSNIDKFAVDEEEIHLMLTTFWMAIFEVVKHDFSREKAISYCAVLSEFFNWQSIIKA